MAEIVLQGVDGETYNIGGNNEKTNFEVVWTICRILDELVPDYPIGITRYEELVNYVKDRPGYDKRYAVDTTKEKEQLGWQTKVTFETGIKQTV